MNELVNTPERDMARAEWQRSVGAVIFGEVADRIFADGPITTPDMALIERLSDNRGNAYGVDPFWHQAHAVIGDIMEARAKGQAESIANLALDGVHRYTHFGSMHRSPQEVVTEAVRAQTSFPLNMVQLIGMESRRRGLPWYRVQTYDELGATLRRPDFAHLIGETLLTRNAVWERLSLDRGVETQVWDKEKVSPIHDRTRHVMHELEFDEEGNVALGGPTRKFLREELKRVNQQGISENRGMADRTSSGCPARHLRPQFSTSPPSQFTVHKLAEAYGKTPEELLRTRETSVVEDGLRFMATILENYDDYTSGRLTTYSDSARSSVSADQQLADSTKL